MENSEICAAPAWKPKRWIALLLGIFLMPWSMLYLGKGRIFACYSFAILLVAISEIWLIASGIAPWMSHFSFVWLIWLGCVIHTYRLAKYGDFPFPRRWYSHWYGITLPIVSVFVGIFVLRSFFFEPFKAPSSSMTPTLPVGSYFIIKKFGYGNYGTFGRHILAMPLSEKIERGDIMVFQYPVDPKIDYVKRIVGLPGDVISYKSKALFINGVPAASKPQVDIATEQIVEEHVGDRTWKTKLMADMPPHDFDFSVPDHQYFVLGDNRDNSLDSRHWGFVPEANLMGKVVYVFH